MADQEIYAEKKMNKMKNKVIKCINEKDKESLKKLFSKDKTSVKKHESTEQERNAAAAAAEEFNEDK